METKLHVDLDRLSQATQPTSPGMVEALQIHLSTREAHHNPV
ncbi:MAG: hypothetical protein WBL63_01130 [Candidatus Acidiferrum sp.]